jgi:hypothetical protein
MNAETRARFVNCQQAVKAGAHVDRALGDNRISVSWKSRAQLEAISVEHRAGQEVRNGMNVQSAADQYGIGNHWIRKKLELEAVKGVAGNEVLEGANVEEVKSKYGIVGGPAGDQLRFLEEARKAVMGGEDVQGVASRFQSRFYIRLEPSALLALSRLAGDPVRRGENP